MKTSKYSTRSTILGNQSVLLPSVDIFLLLLQDAYTLQVSGYSGSAGDSLSFSNLMGFTTRDRDNDYDANRNCAQKQAGAWWYNIMVQVQIDRKQWQQQAGNTISCTITEVKQS